MPQEKGNRPRTQGPPDTSKQGEQGQAQASQGSTSDAKPSLDAVRKVIRTEAGKLFDVLAKDAGTGIREFLKDLARRQARALFQNITAELLGGVGGSVPHAKQGSRLGRILEGTIFGPAAATKADNVSANNAALQANTAALQELSIILSACTTPGLVPGRSLSEIGRTAKPLIDILLGTLGSKVSPPGNAFLMDAFGLGRLGGIFQGRGAALLPLLAGGSFGKLGTVLGATAAGAIFGAKASGFGLAGLGGLRGALLGGGVASGLAFGLLSLFGHRKTPLEREAEIEQVLARQLFTSPQPLSRDLAFGSEGMGERDFGSGDQPRLIVNMNVSAMDSRSFLDHAPALAQAVREAMLHMHPINQLVRESF